MIDHKRVHAAWTRVYGTAYMSDLALQFAVEVEKELCAAAQPREVDAEVLAQLCKLTVELTQLRQAECRHLCVENFAPKLLSDLMRAYAKAD